MWSNSLCKNQISVTQYFTLKQMNKLAGRYDRLFLLWYHIGGRKMGKSLVLLCITVIWLHIFVDRRLFWKFVMLWYIFYVLERPENIQNVIQYQFLYNNEISALVAGFKRDCSIYGMVLSNVILRYKLAATFLYDLVFSWNRGALMVGSNYNGKDNHLMSRIKKDVFFKRP